MDFLEQTMLPVPLWSVIVMLLISVATSLSFLVWTLLTEETFKRWFSVPLGLMSMIVLILLVVWLSIASNAKELAYTEDCEVKVVAFPDGHSAQMFYAANDNHNANQMFSGIVPDDHVVRRYVYKKEYHGIYFTQPRQWLRDNYRIVKKGSPVGTVIPKKGDWCCGNHEPQHCCEALQIPEFTKQHGCTGWHLIK